MAEADFEEFKQKLVEHAKVSVQRAERSLGEEGTKLSLVLPFLSVLGYDALNPDEVSPEHHADFSDKYQNKVDYAIMRHEKPVIAIECKKVGAPLVDDRGQLRSYFNAAPSVKLGVLTDGLRYEFYADSDAPNMMDETAFLCVDLRNVAEGKIDDRTLEGVAAMRKGTFDPENVGAEAKRKLILSNIVERLEAQARSPSDDFVRLFLSDTNLGSRISRKMVDTYRDLVTEAFKVFIDQKILARVGLADKKLVRIEEKKEPEPAPAVAERPTEDRSGIETTDQELKVFHYARERLAFLADSDVLFRELGKVQYRDYKTTFRVFYGQERVGGLFNLRTSREGKLAFTFFVPETREMVVDTLSEIDGPLYESFRHRVQEAGILTAPAEV